MVLKVALLNLGLLAMVVLISSEGEARILAETKETKVVGSRCPESSDCFNIPGWPSIGGIPGFGGIPGIGAIPGIGGNPLIPGGPKAKVVKENDNIGELKDNIKANVVGRCAEGTDCFNIPGWNGGIPGIGAIPGFGGIPAIGVIPGIGGNPLIPGGPKAKVVKENDNIGELKDNIKANVVGRCAEGTDCFNIPGWNGGIPGIGGIPGFGGIPGIGVIPGIGGNPLIPGGPKAKVVKENDNIGELKDNIKANVVGRCAEGTDCFNIPGWNGGIPGIGGIPGFGGIPGIGVIPGIGGNPLIPGGPKPKVVKENDNIGELKDNKKMNVVGRCAEGTDCFNIPGWNGGIPGIGGIPGFGGIPGIGAIPGISGNPLVPGGPKRK